jgi:hypothetical protein
MNDQVEVYEAQPLDIIRSPKDAISEARNAAKELQTVVAGKLKPVIFNNEQYLEFEDWQTVGNFYGLTSKVISTNYIEYGTVRGFEARAVALNRYGAEVSAADSMCLNDEPNWKNKPLFQLRSMAQTRACAKSLRNVLAWVVVLAGYKPTVAEEMTGEEKNGGNGKPGMKAPAEKKGTEQTDIISASVIVAEVLEQTGTNKKTGKTWTKYIIKDDTGEEYGTFSETFATFAHESIGSGIPIEITYKQTKYGKDVENIALPEGEQE